MPNTRQHEERPGEPESARREGEQPQRLGGTEEKPAPLGAAMPTAEGAVAEGRPIERGKPQGRGGLRGTAAMDVSTRKEVARKGGLAVSRNRQHMAEIGRKGGLTVSRNKDHMAKIGRKGGAASRGHRGG